MDILSALGFGTSAPEPAKEEKPISEEAATKKAKEEEQQDPTAAADPSQHLTQGVAPQVHSYTHLCLKVILFLPS